ncbi:universal stress protein [Natrinema longum]|uniref:Universal stress protein n=1 Tax=Natrinema longum TaxID=370324 RepID=A0A8A2U7Z3_9EURY|nr:universal stress protein [Natrinema longum]MBZ6493952.1 universal stress protein [Natrinema longum]QSW84713.1 universal stress protein [Natrinema longum]
MVPRVLVPFDDSKPAADALEYAFDLFPDGDIVVLTVVDTTSLPFVPNAADDARSSDDARTFLGEATDHRNAAETIADEHGTAVETRTRIGIPAQEILEYIERNPVDHVVIGSHGRSGVVRILLGSVAEVVVRHSPVPVTVVR